MTNAKSELQYIRTRMPLLPGIKDLSWQEIDDVCAERERLAYNAGKLWLLAELEKRYRGVCDKYELGLVREYEATVYRIIEEARELCGK